jgi:RNase P protein component
MLSKKYRLPVQSVLSKKGRLVRGRYLFIRIFDAGQTYSRFAVVIGNSVDARSSWRNSMRRLLYNALKQRILTQPRVDAVITLQKAARSADKNVIIDELMQLIS